MAWQLSDDESNTIPIRQGNLPKGIRGEVVSFRINPETLRTFETLLDNHVIPFLETKSDVYRYALDRFLLSLADDVLPSTVIRAKASVKMVQRVVFQQELEDFLFHLEHLIRALDRDDVDGVFTLRKNAEEFLTDVPDGPVVRRIMALFP